MVRLFIIITRILKKCILILFLLLTFHSLFGQETFEKVNYYPENSDYIDFWQNSDSTFSAYSISGNCIVILNWTKECDTLPAKSIYFSKDLEIKSAKFTSDSGFILTGNTLNQDSTFKRLTLIRLDSKGKELWRNSLPIKSDGIDAVEKYDSDFIAVGNLYFDSNYSFSFFYYFISANGDSLNFIQALIPEKFDKYIIHSINRDLLGGYFIKISYAYVPWEGRFGHTFTYIKLSPEFDTLWGITCANVSINFTSNCSNIFTDMEDSSYIIFGAFQKETSRTTFSYDLKYYKIDFYGNLLFENKVVYAHTGYAVKIDSYYYITYPVDPNRSWGINNDIKVDILDLKGNILKSIILGNNSGERPQKILQTLNKKVMIKGMAKWKYDYFAQLNTNLTGEMPYSIKNKIPELKYISTDSNGNNQIYLKKDNLTYILNKAVLLYRQDKDSNNNLIAKISVNDLVYVDSLGFNDTHSFRYSYKYFVQEATSKSSNYEGGVQLNILSGGTSNSWNLNWNNYYSETKNIYNYNVYRGDKIDEMELIKSLTPSARNFTDADVPEGDIFYRIETLLRYPKTLVEGKFLISKSNIVQIVNNSIEEESNTLNLYPNPTTGILNIQNQENFKQLTIYNSVGQIIQQAQLNEIGEQIDLTLQPVGIYYVKLGKEGLTRVYKIQKL